MPEVDGNKSDVAVYRVNVQPMNVHVREVKTIATIGTFVVEYNGKTSVGNGLSTLTIMKGSTKSTTV